ncbi:hypothetical protein M8375_36935, partial [Klebsiella pneumoniae]|nr:hypothetical protein [Klebsiella pneumoniae]
GVNELLELLQWPVMAVAQRHRDGAERVLEIVLASLDEPRKPKPGLTRIKRNLYRLGVLSRGYVANKNTTQGNFPLLLR